MSDDDLTPIGDDPPKIVNVDQLADGALKLAPSWEITTELEAAILSTFGGIIGPAIQAHPMHARLGEIAKQSPDGRLKVRFGEMTPHPDEDPDEPIFQFYVQGDRLEVIHLARLPARDVARVMRQFEAPGP